MSRFFSLPLFSLPLLSLFALCEPTTSQAAEGELLKLHRPVPYQVVQRTGAPTHESDATSALPWGTADLEIRGHLALPGIPADSPELTVEARAILHDQAVGQSTDWTKLAPSAPKRIPKETPHVKVDAPSNPDEASDFSGQIRLAAGGWYRLEVRVRHKADVRLTTSVEAVGVGEVLVIAGQSYATNTNDEVLKVTDSLQRVSAYDLEKKQWAIANDPQPTPDKSDGGSIWPPVGDALAAAWQVPIGFANTAYGGTASQQWLPETNLHNGLTQAGRDLEDFRAVLWQQGESDVISKTPTAQYVENVTKIQQAAWKQWGFQPTWLLAKSTHHPTVYNDHEGEQRIRTAIDELT